MNFYEKMLIKVLAKTLNIDSLIENNNLKNKIRVITK